MTAASPPFDVPALAAALRDAELADQTLYLASEVLRWTPQLPERERRAWGLLVIASLENQRRGSTRLPLPAAGEATEAAAPLNALLEALGIGAADRAAAAGLAARLRTVAALSPLVGEPGAYKPFIVEGNHLYHQRVFKLEQQLAERLGQRLRRTPEPLPAAELAAAIAAAANTGRPLSAGQRAAIEAILTQPLTVISGGPGTGKTSIIVAALRALNALGITADDVAVAAATGKAANRIAVALAAEPTAAATPAPQTLHRLLGYRAGGGGLFRHHENYRLPHRVIFVDESSMIDLALMERLARAARDDARLVLLGDADQLPSVEAGAVFRDLGGFAVTLTESHRMNPALPEGRAIFKAAQAILTGRVDGLAATTVARPDELTFSGVELLEAPAASGAAASQRVRTTMFVNAFLDRWYREQLDHPDRPGLRELSQKTYSFVDGRPDAAVAADLTALFQAEQSRRILCVTRGPGRPTGADAVNAALSRRALANRAPADGAPTPFGVGEPVIMLRNDYDRGLFNGDQGICLRVTAGDSSETPAEPGLPRHAAVFPGGIPSPPSPSNRSAAIWGWPTP